MSKTTERTNPALDKLQNEVAAILNSDTWKASLQLRSRLHAYSFNNLMLVAMQRPDATMLAGYRKWNEFGRHVNKGEKGIAILAPLLRTVTDEVTGEKSKQLYGYRTVYVFDVAQTNGDPLPERVMPTELTDDGDDARAALTDLMTAAGTLGVDSVTVAPAAGGELGAYTPATNRIRIKEGMSAAQSASVLAHELAHAVGKHDKFDGDAYRLQELEAETTAYLVMTALGFDTSGFAFAYLAHYVGDAERLTDVLAAGNRGLKLADTILAALATDTDVDATDAAIAA